LKSLRVVDDDALIAMLFGEILTGMGHEVCATAADQSETVAATARHKPDLMIVDGALREGNGAMQADSLHAT